ncbi:MAG TPA: Rne/Rng family ribonuclease [bacterium]|nr:Rne/Rng family ribonuclease [bacterium]HPG46581.1 Rne/Rng family ribonuclease [bacterium]HPM98363.1 Rne/Rng family ribonuclease [bacterium]
MDKKIIINVSIGETRIAILEDQKLVELFFERPENERTLSNIHFGRVAKVVKGMQAAFINIGQKQDAFLHFSDIGDNFAQFNSLLGLEEAGGHRNSSSFSDPHLKQGQPILVQVTKEPIASKGARVTTNLTLPGRYLVLLPFAQTIGVSRKITNRRERRRLKELGAKMVQSGFGLVIRTISEHKEEKDLKSDYENLIKSWNEMVRQIEKETPPSLVFKDVGMLSSVVRDLFTADITQMVVDSSKMHRQIVRYLKDVSPQMVDRVELYRKKEPIFDAYNIENEISKSLARKVWLKSGGYIFFDHTEALTAIDVNSGRFMGRRSHDANSLKINLEAAKEIARLLRLRDIGGIIIIDFIDMIEEKNRKKLQQDFEHELKADRAQYSVAPLSQFGIIEMTRERVRPNLLFTISEACPACMGTGRIISNSTVAARIERWIKRYRSEKGDRALQLVVHPELAKFLTAGFNNRLRKISWKYWTRVKVVTDDSISMDDFRVLDRDGQEDLTMQFMP